MLKPIRFYINKDRTALEQWKMALDECYDRVAETSPKWKGPVSIACAKELLVLAQAMAGHPTDRYTLEERVDTDGERSSTDDTSS